MATYVVGDIQGCLQPLKALLKQVNFSKDDILWCVGDLVNRGPESLETLNFLISLGERCQTVLGNHDLHLLAIALTTQNKKKNDTLAPILSAPHRQDLLDWLLSKPLLFSQHGYTLVHAGVYPHWSLKLAQQLSDEVCQVLTKTPITFLETMYGNEPNQWQDSLKGVDRLRFITNAFTRMRFCFDDGVLDLTSKNRPEDNSGSAKPWFELRHQQFNQEKILFGHWAALAGKCPIKSYYALDTGFVWGGSMTLLRLDDQQYFSVEAKH